VYLRQRRADPRAGHVLGASQIVAKLAVSAAEARRLGVPRGERVMADNIGTPLTLTRRT
jgi:hypothetical protein